MRAVELLNAVPEAADEQRSAHDEQQIGEDGAGDGGLDEVKQAGADSHDGDDEFGGIAHGGIEQAPDSRPCVRGEGLGRVAQ